MSSRSSKFIIYKLFRPTILESFSEGNTFIYHFFLSIGGFLNIKFIQISIGMDITFRGKPANKI